MTPEWAPRAGGATEGEKVAPEVVVFCGLQGSGKSTFYRQRFAATHTLVSRDLFRNHRRPARRQAELIEQALRAGRSVVVDNTNATPQDRAAIVSLARTHGARVSCFYFGRDLRAAIARNARREGKARVPVVGILATAKRLIAPTVAEGFDAVWQVEPADDGSFRIRALEPPPGSQDEAGGDTGTEPQGDRPHRDDAGPSWRSLLIVAAHPDDETIGAGALLAHVRSAVVVHLTTGAPRDRRFWPAGVTGTTEDYAALRRDELRRALAEAGVVRAELLCLGAPDQEAALALTHSTRELERVIAAHRPALLVTHPYEGGHPDHDAAAFVAHAAVRRVRAEGRPAPLLAEMTSYHARGEVMEKGLFLEARGPEVERVLTPDERARKLRMFAAYASQQEVLASFPVDRERFRLAPPYDFTRPPASEPLLYERWGFALTGGRWRELAAEALRELGLADPPGR